MTISHQSLGEKCVDPEWVTPGGCSLKLGEISRQKGAAPKPWLLRLQADCQQFACEMQTCLQTLTDNTDIYWLKTQGYQMKHK